MLMRFTFLRIQQSCGGSLQLRNTDGWFLNDFFESNAGLRCNCIGKFSGHNFVLKKSSSDREHVLFCYSFRSLLSAEFDLDEVIFADPLRD